MICLSKRSNGFYYIYYNTPERKVTSLSTRTKYKAEAVKFLSDFKTELKNRNAQKLESISLSSFIQSFLSYSKTVHTAKTVRGYKLH